MGNNGDFDLRSQHGFRNPPMLPVVPFPGMWENKAQNSGSRQFKVYNQFAFRRPPRLWRSLTQVGFPGNCEATSLCRTDGSLSGSNALKALNYRHAFAPQPQLRVNNRGGSEEHKVESVDVPNSNVRMRSTDLPSRNVPEELETHVTDAASVITCRGQVEKGAKNAFVPGSETLRRNEESDAQPLKDLEETETSEEVELVMNPEWAEHFRRSPSVQRYLERVRSYNGSIGRGVNDPGGKSRGNNKNSRNSKPGAVRGKKKQSMDRKHAVKDPAGKEVGQKDSLQRQIEGQAIQYANRHHRPLEDIVEES